MTVKIEKVEVFCLQDPNTDFVRFEGSYQNVLVVVHGENGEYGIGESDSPPQVVKALIETPGYNYLSCGLSSVLEGEVLDDPRRLWTKMYKETSWHGRHGVAIHAISALDIALWDLFGKSSKRPLFDFFGGVKHGQLPAYATIYPMEKEPVDFKKQIGNYLDQGFQRIKICVEPWWKDQEKTIENLTILREWVGSDIDLMLDVAMEFSHLSQLDPFLETLQQLDFKWIEAPFDLGNIKDHRMLRASSDIPVGVGDLGLTTCQEFERFIEADAFDIAQPDITMFGGPSEVMKLKERLGPLGKRIIPHAYNTDITIGVNAHFLCTQNQMEPLEYSTSPSILRQKLIKNPLEINKEGLISINKDCYGLGLEPNWDIIRTCKVS